MFTKNGIDDAKLNTKDNLKLDKKDVGGKAGMYFLQKYIVSLLYLPNYSRMILGKY